MRGTTNIVNDWMKGNSRFIDLRKNELTVTFSDRKDHVIFSAIIKKDNHFLMICLISDWCLEKEPFFI